MGNTRALKLTEHARDMLFEAYPEQGRRVMGDLVAEQKKLVDLSEKVLREAEAAAEEKAACPKGP